jgi:hypothetical protein
MGTVMGHGDALQVSCLQGFDSLGLHQIVLATATTPGGSLVGKPIRWLNIGGVVEWSIAPALKTGDP